MKRRSQKNESTDAGPSNRKASPKFVTVSDKARVSQSPVDSSAAANSSPNKDKSKVVASSAVPNSSSDTNKPKSVAKSTGLNSSSGKDKSKVVSSQNSASTSKASASVANKNRAKADPDSDMPPVSAQLQSEVEQIIKSHNVVVFSKTACPFCVKAKDFLKSLSIKFENIDLDQIERGAQYHLALQELTGQKTVPNIFIRGRHLGGCDDLMSAHCQNTLMDRVTGNLPSYEYDLVVIGGGSGGLAAAKEAANLGKKVALFDYVQPSPCGTSWGIGGTCVNVGCIPKKLMHRASILGEDIHDAKAFGWEVPNHVEHNWQKMKDAIQDHIGSLNWGYRVQLRDKKVNYINAYAELIDDHTVKGVKKNKQEQTVTAEHILLAMGERPRYLNIPGDKEYCITSDDLFSLPYCPGKTLCVGASYVALECAGFLAGLGLDTTVMVRSILLRGFDQQCAEMIGKYMSNHGVKFVRGAIPIKIEQLEKGEPGRYRVTSKTNEGTEIVDEYNTILLAVGRDPCTKGIGLEKLGVELSPSSHRVITDSAERTSVNSVFAIGDIGEGRPELTPVAIHAGKLLSKRLFARSQKLVDYTNIATTVFTPLEYGCIGYSEEAAIQKFGEENIEVYHSYFMPLEWTVPHRAENTCYAKLICNIADQERVVGFHVLGPNAGEITQGFAVAIKKGATKEDFDVTIGIHPTCSETFTTLHVTKRSGESAEVTGC